MGARINMKPAYPPFHTLSQMDDRVAVTIYVVARNSKGELQTQEFFEKVPEPSGMVPMKPANWDMKIPEQGRIFGSDAGMSGDAMGMFWAGWTDAQGIHALALMQEHPITASLAPGDLLIHPPVMNWDKKLRFYFWRKQDKGYSLFCHIFTGEIHKHGESVTKKILDLPYEPLNTEGYAPAIELVPKMGPVERAKIVLSWTSIHGQDMRVHTLWLTDQEALLIDSDPILGYRPIPKQRLGVWAWSDGTIYTSWVMSKTDANTARMGEFIQSVKVRSGHLRIQGNALGDMDKIHSAACLAPKIPENSRARCFVLTQSGNLYSQSEGTLEKLRDRVPLDYDFPMIYGSQSLYEARYNEKGEVYFTDPASK